MVFLVLFAVFIKQKFNFNWNVSITDHESGICFLNCSELPINWKTDSSLTISRHDVIVTFLFFDFDVLSFLVTCPSFMSVSWLVLEFWQFSVIKIDQNNGNRKHLCLSFTLYLETGASYGYQIWQECLWLEVTECCKMPGLLLLPFLCY